MTLPRLILNHARFLLFLLAAGVISAGCHSTTGPRKSPSTGLTVPLDLEARSTTNGVAASRVTPVNSPPRLHAAQKWNPCWWFGNMDDPTPPQWYRPEDPHRVAKWKRRNPLHNFTFYVVGIADKDFRRVGRYPDQVFNPHEGWNWAVCKYKVWRLPFISYRHGSLKFYLGWRERGNFGAKFTFEHD